jgi:putative FmdB family regulatory protein
MPIYAYRCATCGFEKDFLQKMSDPVLTVCPECGKETFNKKLTAAGFLLKGSGWYATDFKGGGSKSSDSKGDGGDSGGDKGTKSLQHSCAAGACSCA